MYKLFRPFLFRMDAERAHDVSLRMAKYAQSLTPGMVSSLFEFEDERLKQRLLGSTFSNPLGLAAGADKNAVLVDFWEAVGFGFVEVGSVTAQASKGNPQPRAFRVQEDGALINRMGLNNEGAAAVAKRLGETRSQRKRPLGVNIAKTHSPDIMGEAAVEDFRESFRLLAPQASYVALNVSCPNTREGKTFEDPEALDALLTVIMKEREAPERRVPVLIKVSPPNSPRIVFDSELEEMIAIAVEHGVDGFIATNTASDRSGLTAEETDLDQIGQGGMSGAPLHARSTQMVRYLYRATDGETPIIGVGGIRDAETAYNMICAGASLIQMYTGLVYEGPGLVKQIKQGLVERMKRDDHTNIGEAVGTRSQIGEAAQV
ncbi:dihydroorotate dehydrogenase (quinone) [Longibacter salinarum]|uniref:Dihydroorotate dehydrogenase (quinone) n=1 Tax=Longibacter salinarum TaxID=1850348 RepID=A0A2A8D0K0_9BACT|nr:quinone-dependent dihydroorotate dehydrogenase [Longibacter salinarum]PEN14456.1 dihydroorotate dehydrogenase (quinone) [Longibacter salinarum]